MNLLFFIHSMRNSGGMERVVANLSNNWIKKNREIEILTISRPNESFYQLDARIKVIALGLPEMPENKILLLFWHVKVLWNFYLYLKRRKNFHQMIFSIDSNVSCCAILVSRLLNCKVIACEHFSYDIVNILWRTARRLIFPFAYAVVTLTEEDKNIYQKFCPNVMAIPNIKTFEFDDMPDYASKQVLTIGRLVNQKGYDMLIEAWNIVKQQYLGWKLFIIGKGENYDGLSSQIKEYHLEESIIILPPTKNIISYYKTSSIFVSSSRHEGYPLVVLEAMTVGLPIVSFNCSAGSRELLDNGRAGILVQPGDIHKLAARIMELMGSEDMRREYGLKAKEQSEAHSFEAINMKWDQLINSL